MNRIVHVQIAKEVRKRIKRYVAHLKDRTGGWCTIEPENLQGACAISSHVLANIYSRLGLKANFVTGEFEGGNHCWVTIGDTIIDITATQFGPYPPVHIDHTNNRQYCPELKNKSAFKKINDEWSWSQSTRGHQEVLKKIEDAVVRKFSNA